MNARVGPAFLPAIQIQLSGFQTFKALTLQRRLLCVADAGFHFAFPVGIADPARHGHGAVVGQYVAIERIQSRIVNVGLEHTFSQVVGNHDSGGAAQAAEGLLVQFGPRAGARMKAKKPDALAAETERQHEQTCAPVLAGLCIADHGAATVIDLRLFAWRRLDDAAGFRQLRTTQFAGVALDALIGAGEAMPVHQFLPDGHGIASQRQRPLDEFAIRFARAGSGTRRGFPVARVGGHLTPIGWFCRRRVGGHLIGRF